ncbi:uncharacterized protein LOC111333185 isoform X2 [Stylophora pistillata]|nr:uncharacterized protein LOC111333185 isoform X2 [Stylophora pistillata]XP_022794453.1 uncharacterized protein LOC111333185 isoform X2 [Stylophora pistillata]
MLFSSAIVSVDEVQVYIFTQVNGKKSGGSLLSFLPNSAGESKARVNPKMVRDFNLEDADITFTNQVNVTSTRQVRVYSVFNLSLTNTALGGKSVVLHELIVLVTTHDKNGTEHRHDQHYTLNYTKTQVSGLVNVSFGSVHKPTGHQKDIKAATASVLVNVSSGSVHKPTGHQKDIKAAAANLAVPIAVPIVVTLFIIGIIAIVVRRYQKRNKNHKKDVNFILETSMCDQG